MNPAVTRSFLFLLAFGSLACSTFAQARDEEEVERIESSVEPAPDAQRPDLSQSAELIVEQTNEFRREEELEPLAVDETLTTTAEKFARYMAETDTYGHTAGGNRPIDRVREEGYEPCLVLENIAYRFDPAGFSTRELAHEFVTGWKESPGHRENMLDPDVTATGVGLARSSETGHYYGVQLFGRPKSKSIEFTIANRSDETVTYTIGEKTYQLPPRLRRTHGLCRDRALEVVTTPDSAPAFEGPTKVDLRNGLRLRVVEATGGKLALRRVSERDADDER